MPRGARTIRQIRQVCHRCRQLHTGESSQGIYFRCQWCGALNAGPRLIAEYGIAPPVPRRQSRRAGATNKRQPVAPARRPPTFLELLTGRRSAGPSL